LGLLQVMLMSGLTVGAFAKFLSEKTTELDKPFHLHNLLKFVALRKDRSAIMAAGGTWDPEVDGGDPAIDDTALIRAVIRLIVVDHTTLISVLFVTWWLVCM
jgi:hypothetical protein